MTDKVTLSARVGGLDILWRRILHGNVAQLIIFLAKFLVEDGFKH
jgi:hypothetical protein